MTTRREEEEIQTDFEGEQYEIPAKEIKERIER